MRILSRRFLASYLAALAACVGGCLLALTIVDMLVDFDAVVEGGATALFGLLVRVPERWLWEALPLAAFAAAFLAVALPARRGEILALRTAGIHPGRAMLPILAPALAIGLAAAALPGPEPAREATGSAQGPGVEDGVWRLGDEGLYRIGGRDPHSGELRDLRFLQVDPGFRLRRLLHAAGARAMGDRWELRSATELRFDPARPAAAPLRVGAPSSLAAPPAALGRGAAEGGTARPLGGALATASVCVLSLLAIPMGLGVRAGGVLAGRALAALALAALFRGAWQSTLLAGPALPVPALAPWLVLAAFGGLAAVLWARAPR